MSKQIKEFIDNCNVIVNRQILTNRQSFMGLAILMVVGYHVIGRFGIINPTCFLNTILSKGFSGVDVFLFFLVWDYASLMPKIA